MTATLDPVDYPIDAVPFDAVEPVLTPQGHRIRPLIDAGVEGGPAGNITGLDLCMCGVDVPAGFVAKVHYHEHTDIIVLVWDCGDEGVVTLFGPELQWAKIQHPGEPLAIKKGWAHTMVNLSLTKPARAYEARANSTAFTDNLPLPALQSMASMRATTLLKDTHGADEVTRFHERQIAKALAGNDSPVSAERPQLDPPPTTVMTDHPIHPYADHPDAETARWAH